MKKTKVVYFNDADYEMESDDEVVLDYEEIAQAMEQECNEGYEIKLVKEVKYGLIVIFEKEV